MAKRLRLFTALIAAAALAACSAVVAQSLSVVQVVVTLVDSELRVRPVPKHALLVTSEAGDAQRLVTDLEGQVEIALAPGAYVIHSVRPVEFQGKSYSWRRNLAVESGQSLDLDLSSDSADIEGTMGAVGSDLPTLFRRWQDSVVTVWSETGHGSGFVVDRRGLILTNQHVVGVSEYVAVQFDDTLKVPAVVVSQSPDQDVAVLRVHPRFLESIRPVELGFARDDKVPVVEGEQVFTIGSPLNQRKAMTSGIVSRLERTALISDVNINHGNSGGPLFTLTEKVVGITTFGDFTNQGGPGVSGIIRIDEARSALESAVAILASADPPSDTVLPVEPTTPYPIGALREVVASTTIRRGDYQMRVGDFDVTFVTPVLTYGLSYQYELEALRERLKRNNRPESVQGTVSTFDEYKNWASYVGEFRPVLLVDARPRLVEGFWSGFGRGLAAAQGMATTANLHFKADFYRMELRCDGTVVQPIHPGKIEHRVAVDNAAVRVNDVSYEGFHSYDSDAIGPQCTEVSLTLYSEREPEKGEGRVLSSKLVQRLWTDFDAYRATRGAQVPLEAVTAGPKPAVNVPAPELSPRGGVAGASAAPPSGTPQGTDSVSRSAEAIRTPEPAGVDAFRRATQYEALDRIPDAVSWYEQAIALLPDDDPRRQVAIERLAMLRPEP